MMSSATKSSSQTRQSLAALSKKASENKEAFWDAQASCLDWFEPWDQVLDWTPPYAKWFTGGKLNACYNCVDRHMEGATRHKTALLWEGEKGEERSLTYEDLYSSTQRFANVLKSLGVKKGDRVAIYLPMIPEAVIAMLSCARIGAAHTVIFGGFSADAVKDRIIDSEAKVIITADGGFRKGKELPLKSVVDEALKGCPDVSSTLVIKHTSGTVFMQEGRDHWYQDLAPLVPPTCAPEVMDAEDILYILYTSGTTGKPKGIIHTTGGYMVSATLTTKWVFDVQKEDKYWCTADVGWVTGHSYVVYGPLSNGMTQLIYEGALDFPEQDRVWKLIEKYGITILYTAPTAIRTFMKWGDHLPKRCDLSSLRLLGSVGEPINPEAWNWFHTQIGKEKCPIVDTWWQTETGSIMIAPIPGETPLKPGSATFPLPGIDAMIVDDENNLSTSGYLTITSPWPSMLRGIYKDSKRYENTYKDGVYITGDSANLDEDGYFWLMGRVDDVMNISGHRLGTMEVESALVDHPSVAEAAVIGAFHPIKGQGIICFVTLKASASVTDDLEKVLKQHVASKIGALARPEKIIFICELPKTRSGKIMRRLLRDIAEERVIGDTSTLSDPSVLKLLKDKFGE
jgi:acetyl-CoA synthetase